MAQVLESRVFGNWPFELQLAKLDVQETGPARAAVCFGGGSGRGAIASNSRVSRARRCYGYRSRKIEQMRSSSVFVHGSEGQQLLQRGMRSCEAYAGHRLPLRASRLQRTLSLKRRMLMAPKNKTKTANRPKSTPEEIDPVAESSDESFPASDAPAWMTSGDGRSALNKKKNRKRGLLRGNAGNDRGKADPSPPSAKSAAATPSRATAARAGGPGGRFGMTPKHAARLISMRDAKCDE